MKHTITKAVCSLFVLLLFCSHLSPASACSTFKLQKGDALIYGHNLNQGDIGVPGMIFINTRGIFKTGRTWSELASKDGADPSSFHWISRYGSVTFNAFGKDFPDGGMNEAGLYIWEMNEDADYPQNENLPTMNQMNWMQFILDSYSTVDEAIRCASEIEIEGWGWHYFVGDATGDCAAIAFIDGEVVVNRGGTMPVPALLNTPYDRELEILKYYKGFGGLYEPDLHDPNVPRFVKAAAMIRDYDPAHNAVEYGMEMLDNLQVYDVPEWSVLIDVNSRDVYFKTRINPEVKQFDMNEIDFSNNSAVSILNMDIEAGSDVLDQFHPYSNREMRAFLKSYVVPILPETFFTRGGLTMDEYLDRFSSHSDAAALADNQYFTGIWKNATAAKEDKLEVTLNLYAKKDAVFGTISISQESVKDADIEHLQLIGNNLRFTCMTQEQRLLEVKAFIQQDTMTLDLFSTENNLGSATLIKHR